MSTQFSGLPAFIWPVADLLRGDFKQSQYAWIILPVTLLRRLECVLAPTKDAVIGLPKGSPLMTQLYPLAEEMFTDVYALESDRRRCHEYGQVATGWVAS